VLRVFYSNQTEKLLYSLVYNIQVYRSQTGAGLFEPTPLIVPNKNIETYVKLGIARLTGIAANIEVGFLRSLIDDLAQEAAGDDKPVLNKTHLTDRILTALLDEELLRAPELEPVRDYLNAAGPARDAIDLRRFQLAKELTRLFDEYSVSRDDLLEIWKDEPAIHDEEYRKTEVWQRHLWLSLFEKDTWTTPVEILKSADPETLSLPTQIHIFGVSYMARAFLEILGHLSQSADIDVYTLNPCLEVWDQGMAPAETKEGLRYERRSAELGTREVYILEDPYRLESSTEMPALALWSRPGRENLRLLNALTGCDLISEIEDPLKNRDKHTLLRQIQHDIATREPERETISGDFDFADDESLVLFSCPAVRREIEIIAAEIWSLIKKDDAERTVNDEPLRFNDIAVILPPSQAEAYQSLIGSVFGEMHRIPHNIVDLPIGGESRIAEAMELLLALPLGKFTRQELLRLATHPAVMARFPEASPGDWLGWCNALGIVHGADRRDHEDTYINKDVFNWDQGLKRLALGAFMSGERSGDTRIFEEGGRQYVPEEVPTDQMASAAQFGLLIRSLIEDARSALQDRRPLDSWMNFVTAMITTYLIPQNDEDERVLRNALRRVNDLADMKLDGKKLTYRIPYELVRSELAGFTGSLGQYLVDGVVVSTFLPMRAIPFKVIFIAGLGEKQFPTADRKNLLDLRQARRHAGDVSPREQDNYMFLETMLSAREKLYLSYVGRDELTGDRLEPSSVVLELRHMLERGYVGEIRERTFPPLPPPKWSTTSACSVKIYATS
jgi:exodeoxyribonuclease V gamma subunit